MEYLPVLVVVVVVQVWSGKTTGVGQRATDAPVTGMSRFAVFGCVAVGATTLPCAVPAHATTILVVFFTGEPTLLALSVAEPTSNVYDAPAARLTDVQLRTASAPVIVQRGAAPPAGALVIDQCTVGPLGRLSTRVVPVAVAVPVLETVTLSPTGFPANTPCAVATTARESFGIGVG